MSLKLPYNKPNYSSSPAAVELTSLLIPPFLYVAVLASHLIISVNIPYPAKSIRHTTSSLATFLEVFFNISSS